MVKNHMLFLDGGSIRRNTDNYVLIVVPGLPTGPSSLFTSTSSTSASQDSVRGDLRHVQQAHEVGENAVGLARFQRNQKHHDKNEDNDRARRSFTDNLADEKASASSEAPASISREPLFQEPSISGTFDKSGIGQAQHFYLLPERPKLRSLRPIAVNALVIKHLEEKS